MDTESICSNIRNIRKKLGKTQEEMAEMLNIGRCTYINLEGGRTAVVSDYVYKLAALSSISPEQVLIGPDFTDTFLNECADFEESVRTLKKQYQAELDEKDNEISALKDLVEVQKLAIESDRETIKTQQQMNKILQDRIEKLESKKTIDIENNFQ